MAGRQMSEQKTGAILSAWPYLALFTFTLLYYYFFTERLPWFWYDDVQQLELAEQTTLPSLLKDVFTFNAEDYGGQAGRPVLRIFVKCCALFFDEIPHYYRIVKLTLFILALFALYYLLVKHGVHSSVALLCLSSFAVFPQVMIVSAWVNEAATLELFFKATSFLLFFLLLKEADMPSIKSAIVGALLVAVVIFADKSKATAKIIPLIFLSYLILTKNKKPFLYAVTMTALLAVFPFGALGASRSSSGLLKTQFAFELFSVFLTQISWLLIVAVFFVAAGWKNASYRDQFILFAALWLAGEMAFFFIYPSDEMRYLFSSLCAASVLLSVLISRSLSSMKSNTLQRVFLTGFVSAILVMFAFSTRWNYNFRGTLRHVCMDKAMKYVNSNYGNSLCLYFESALDCYVRNTSNSYVNLHPKFDDSARLRNVVRYNETSNRLVLSFDLYKNILTINMPFSDTNKDIEKIIDSRIEGSLFDELQGIANIPLHAPNLYNTSLNGEIPYPAFIVIYKAPTIQAALPQKFPGHPWLAPSTEDSGKI